MNRQILHRLIYIPLKLLETLRSRKSPGCERECFARRRYGHRRCDTMPTQKYLSLAVVPNSKKERRFLPALKDRVSTPKIR